MIVHGKFSWCKTCAVQSTVVGVSTVDGLMGSATPGPRKRIRCPLLGAEQEQIDNTSDMYRGCFSGQGREPGRGRGGFSVEMSEELREILARDRL